MWLKNLHRLVGGFRSNRSARPASLRRRVWRPMLEVLEDRMVLSTLTVMNTSDSGAGSLRAEIAAAKSGDTIQFASGLAGQTINLTSGDLLINKNLTITGLTNSGKPDITLNANFSSRIFDIEGGSKGVNVTLQNLIVENGSAGEGGGLYINDTAGTVKLNNLFIESNNARGANGANGGVPGQPGAAGQAAQGGGVFFTGGQEAKLVISNSILQNNMVHGGDGGQGASGGVNSSTPGVGGGGGAGGAAAGGALYAVGGSLQLSNDLIQTNSATGGAGGKGGKGGITVSHSNGKGGSGGDGGVAAGAGLYLNASSVQLSGDTLQFNQAKAGKGGLGGHGEGFSSGTTQKTGVSGSGANSEGGGVFVNTGSVQIVTSTFRSNSAAGGSEPGSKAAIHSGGNGFGGGIYVGSGSLIVSSTALIGNSAFGGGSNNSPGNAYGGAVALGGGYAYLFNDTITLSNIYAGAGTKVLGAASGGALAVLGGDLRLTNDTVANNAANGGTAFNGNTGMNAYGGAVANVGGFVEMSNTILAFNTDQNATNVSPEIYGTINASSHDIIDNASDTPGSFFMPGPGDQVGITPNLAPLGNYGGPTQTMPLLPGSPGIDQGSNSFQGRRIIPGLADWWKGDGNAEDSGPLNDTGATVGGVGYVPGLAGQAFNFSGQGTYVAVGTGPDITGTSDFTIGVWVRTTSDGTIINQRDPSNYNGEYYLGIQGGKVYWYTFGNNQYGFNFTSARSVNDGNWHYIAVTRLPDGTGQIYIDATLDSSQSVAPVPLSSGIEVYLGEDVRNAVDVGPSYANNFVGQMEDVQIYHQGLSASQIQSLATPSYFASGFGPAGAYPASLSGLVSWLPGEGNFADVVGANSGTPQGGVSFTKGKVGQAFQLDGKTGQINIADNASLDPSSFTVVGWFQLTQAPASGSVSYLASKDDGNSQGWTLSVNSSLVPTFSVSNYFIGGNPNTANATSSMKLALNKWYYIAATFDGGSDAATLYINGAAVGSASLSGGYQAVTTPLVIGAASWTNGGYLAGKVDEFAFYNRALTSGEVGLLSTPVTTDQRGGARQVGKSVDIGATEYQYDLAATGSAPSTATPGSTITYTLTVTNKGLDPVPNVTFSDTLPNDVTYQSLSVPSGWTLGQPKGQTITATSSSGLAPGASATFTLTAVVKSTTPVGTVLTDKVSVTPTTYDTNTGNNNLSLKTTVVAATVSTPALSNNAPTGQSSSPVQVAGVPDFPSPIVISPANVSTDVTVHQEPSLDVQMAWEGHPTTATTLHALATRSNRGNRRFEAIPSSGISGFDSIQ